MNDYTDFLEGGDSKDYADFLEKQPTKDEGKGHVFRQAGKPAKEGDSWIARILGRYAPEIIDFAGGASSTMRGGLNLASEGLGEKVFPSSAVDKESWPYVAGQVADPAAYAIGAGAGKVLGVGKKAAGVIPKLTVGNVARSSAAGGTSAAATTYLGTEGDLEATGMSGLFGTGLGATLPIAAKAGQRGIGWLTDFSKGNLDKVRAGEIARAAAGGNLEAIKQAMRNAPKDATAGQAAYGIDQDMWQALQKLAKDNDPSSYYRLMEDKQTAARIAKLAAVTPNLEQSLAERSATMAKNMESAAEKARLVRMAREASQMPPKPTTVRSPMIEPGLPTETRVAGKTPDFLSAPSLENMKGNKVIQSMMAEARKRAANRSNLPDELAKLSDEQIADIIKDPTKSLEGLQLMKASLDDRFRDPSNSSSALAKFDDSTLTIVKKAFTQASETAAPGWGQARAKFAEQSAPVNQALILKELSSVLEKPTGGERVTPFLNALGRGEESALNRAKLNTRFGGIEDVLTPAQNAAVGDVKTQLVREAELATQAKAGSKAMNDVAEQFRSGFRLPSQLNATTTFTNKFLEFVEKRLNIDTKQRLIEGMRNGKSALEMLDTLPTAERNKVLLFINQAGQSTGAAGVAGGVYGSSSK